MKSKVTLFVICSFVYYVGACADVQPGDIPPTLMPTLPSPLIRAYHSGWQDVIIQTICLAVGQAYPYFDPQFSLPIEEATEHVLSRLGFQVVEEGTPCNARLKIEIKGYRTSADYINIGRCFTGSEIHGLMSLTSDGLPPISLPIDITDLPPGATYGCPNESDPLGPNDGAFENLPEVLLDDLVSLWGSRVLVEALDQSYFNPGKIYTIPSQLQELGPEAAEAVPLLIQILELDHPGKYKDEETLCRVKLAAILAVGQMGIIAKEAIPTLIRILNNRERNKASGCGGLEYNSMEALGHFGSEAAPSLSQALQDEDFESPGLILLVLQEIGPEAKDAVPGIIWRLKWETKHKVLPDMTIQTLGKIGPGAMEAVPLIIQVWKDSEDADWTTRAECSIALTSITGQDLGANVDRWQQWWEEQQ